LKRVPAWLPLLLGYLTAVGPLSTDMYLPGLPAIEASFAAPPGSSQITLATWLLGLAIGQVVQGSLSDRFGRRGPLLAGFGLYVLATIGCALAPSLAVMATWRVVAALGASAGMVIPRAVVRDFTSGNAAARMMSQQMLVMGVAPILAPTLGGFMLAYTGWQAIFWFQVGFGLLAMALITLFLPDSMAEEHRARLDVAGMVARYRSIIVERGFLTNTMIAGFCAVAIFSYLGGAPVVYSQMFGLSPVQSGMMFGTNAGAFILFSQINGALVHRIGGARLLQAGTVLFAFAGALTTITSWTGWGGTWGIAVPMTSMVGATGLIMPNTAVGALAKHPMQAGSASALMGTLQYGMGALSGAIVSTAADGSARPMGLMMLVAAVGVMVAERARRV